VQKSPSSPSKRAVDFKAKETCRVHRTRGRRASEKRLGARCIFVFINVIACRVAEYCSVMQCVAVCCSVLQCDAVCCKCASWGNVAFWFSSTSLPGVLQRVAACCSVLQCDAVCCSVHNGGMLHFGFHQRHCLVCCSVLQCVAVCCCVLLCDAVCCVCIMGARCILVFINVIAWCVAACCTVLHCVAV